MELYVLTMYDTRKEGWCGIYSFPGAGTGWALEISQLDEDGRVALRQKRHSDQGTHVPV